MLVAIILLNVNKIKFDNLFTTINFFNFLQLISELANEISRVQTLTQAIDCICL